MPVLNSHSRTILSLLLVLLMVGCVGAPVAKHSASPQIDRSGHENIFSVGFHGISEKYIDSIPVSKIAMDGLAGFSSIDPALQIARDGSMINLSISGKIIHTKPSPRDNDFRGWATVTTDFAHQARSYSRLMREASNEKFYKAVFDSVLSDLDIFSRYAGATEARRNRDRRDGFGGIGIQFESKDGKLILTTVMPDTPASDVELKVNDEITLIDGLDLTNLSFNDVVKKLRGPTHSKVRIRIYREATDRIYDKVMERKHIVPTTVTTNLKNGIAILKISSFNQATARNVAKALRSATQSAKGNLKGLVIDLRGNPGGLLKQSVKVANLLLSHGHILSTQGRHPDSLHHYEAGGRDLVGGLPIAVLVDGKSASASEIVAAALQDGGRAVVIGTSSFGKGTVQTVIRLPNDGEITLTWSRFVTPSGYVLHGLGVRPVVCTSGRSSASAAITHRIGHPDPQERAIFSSWRTTAFEAKKRRKELRNTCVSERRKGNTELQVARIILKDQTLYRQAIDITAVPSQAQK